jgi:hypothetical protein
MDKEKKEALQVTKEIVVKFIETGRISPTNFNEFFASIYVEVLRTITEDEPAAGSHAQPDARD